MVKLLIVDDEFAITNLLEMALLDEGYHVKTARNGLDALERLSEGPPPDMIISDYMMPALDVVGLYNAMQEMPACRGIPLIIMSGMPEENVRHGITAYAAFVRKPFRLAEVLTLIAAICSASSYLSG